MVIFILIFLFGHFIFTFIRYNHCHHHQQQEQECKIRSCFFSPSSYLLVFLYFSWPTDVSSAGWNVCVYVCMYVHMFFSYGLDRLFSKVCRLHTHTHTHTVGLLSMSDQLVSEAAIFTTKQTHETNIHALSGIRTRDPSNRAAAELRSDRMATGIGLSVRIFLLNIEITGVNSSVLIVNVYFRCFLHTNTSIGLLFSRIFQTSSVFRFK